VQSTVSKEDPTCTGGALVLRDTAFGGPQDEGSGLRAISNLPLRNKHREAPEVGSTFASYPLSLEIHKGTELS
jgi:hypothetical protein